MNPTKIIPALIAL
jgi:hypothetical protein